MSSSPADRAQSSPIGVILIIGLTLTAAVGIVVVGGDVIEGTQSESQLSQAEQAMTQFDARAAQVALGDSDSQTVSLGGQGGQYSVEEGVGRVRLLHEDWNGTDCGVCDDNYGNDSDTINEGNTTILYNQTLGAMVYESGNTTIAYQGGGVWRQGPEGESRPVSSPEFHYRDATLTFPLVRVRGSGSASGQAQANVQRVETTKDIYPNQSRTYPDDEKGLENPVEGGNITAEITSDYCEAWRTYFEERTEGDVSECNGGTVTANIAALGLQGAFSPRDGEKLPVRGYEGMENFEITFRPSGSQNSKFNNLDWSMAAENGDRKLEFSVQGNGAKAGDPVAVAIYYEYNDTVYDGWMNDQDFKIKDTSDGEELTVDFMSNNKTNWQDLQGSDLTQTDSTDTQNSSRPSELPDSSENMSNVTAHYFDLIGDVDFQIVYKNNAGLSDASTGLIEYKGGGNVVTYLHVTENRVEVELS